MNIGEASKASKVSAKMIRYYEQIGLLPEAERSAGNQRLYSRKAQERLAFIRHCRALDMPLEPAETYSSSPHLFTDLDIPAGTKGRLNSTPIPRAEKAAGRPPRDSQPREPRGESAIDKPAGSGRTRQRRRRPAGGGAPTE